MIHLDTSFLIRALRKRTSEDSLLRRWLRDRADIAISVICWTEFLCGPVSTQDIEMVSTLFPEPLPFEPDNAVMAAGLFNASGRRRGSLTDCMVAATAVHARATLATSNAADFKRFEAAGLTLVEP